jgi:putative copper export protein
MRLALIPAAAELPDDQRQALQEGVRRRWSQVVHAAILFLLVTGLYNFIWFVKASHTWGAAWQAGSSNATLYQILFGVKFLLALAVFFIASATSGRSAALARFREQAKFWVTVNLLLGVLIVCIAGQMRAMHAGPNAPPPASSARN